MIIILMTKGGSIETDHLPNHPKVQGLSPVAATGNEREKMGQKICSK
jgi:hypothetical protein